MKWFRRTENAVVAELIEEPSADLVRVLRDDPIRQLPSSVVVMSADGVTWAKEWGAQPIHFVQERWIAYNTDLVTFGPMRRGWSPYIAYFDVLNRQGEPMFGWQTLNRPLALVMGDTFQFAPGSLIITMTFGPSPDRGPTPRMPLEQTYRKLER